MSLLLCKNIGHITWRPPKKDVSDFFIEFVGAFIERPRANTVRPYEASKKLINQGLLQRLFDRNGNRNGHTEQLCCSCHEGCYRLQWVPSFLRFRGFSHSFGVESCRPKALPHKPFWYICIAKSLSAEHIVLEFAECIISCFEAFVNGFGGSLFATFLLIVTLFCTIVFF